MVPGIGRLLGALGVIEEKKSPCGDRGGGGIGPGRWRLTVP